MYYKKYLLVLQPYGLEELINNYYFTKRSILFY